ncbi:MAG: hypothetical protein KA116_03925 [Proteobacteria bacterium]|nr:hypothetical protein [Pseudomonadota bacterium]
MKRSKSYWESLKLLRENFLNPQIGNQYWKSYEDLALYDESFGERIRWKALQVIEELKVRNYPSQVCEEILDWGCGSGIFIDAYLDQFPEHKPTCIYLEDHSEIAVNYALEKLSHKYPHLVFKKGKPSFEKKTLTLISHVLNECSEKAQSILNTIGEHSEAMIWLESGTALNSKNLGAMRERLKRNLKVWAPCPHQERCPMLNREKDWCHNFAKIPQIAFHDAYWEDFSKELGIDRHRLPYTYLALHKATPQSLFERRHIGEARLYKAWAETLICENDGQAHEVRIQKRDQKELFKQLKRNPFPHTF